MKRAEVSFVDVMRYYVNYHDYELELINALKNNAPETFSLFTKYKNSYMSVGRNFKTKSDETILRMLLDFNDFNGDYVVKFSNKLRDNGLLSGKIENVFSAASKFLWLKKNDTIIIDGNNMTALKAHTNSYEAYCSKWVGRYGIHKSEIENIIEKYSLEEVNPIFSEEWFRMRVFDQYLWGSK